MANLSKLGKGFGIFLASAIMTSFMFLLLTAIFGALNDPTDANAVGDTIEGTFWFVTFIIWVLGVIVFPCVFYYEGTTDADDTSPIIKGTLGVLMFILGMLITIRTYFMATALSTFLTEMTTTAGVFEGTIILIIYWLGLIINWAALVLVVPYYLVADARAEMQ